MTGNLGLGAIRTLDYTMLLCEDVEAMGEFYADVLGLSVRHEIPGRYLEFQVGSAVLALRGRTRSYDGPPAARAAVQLAFRVPPDDVDVAAAQLQDLGVALLEPVHDLTDFGHRVLFFADPEDNVIEIYAEI